MKRKDSDDTMMLDLETFKELWSKTYNTDVETVHRLVEEEFYEVEVFSGREDFLKKAALYNLWFNVARKNSYKGNKTPWEIAEEKDSKVDPKLPILAPVFLDELYFQ